MRLFLLFISTFLAANSTNAAALNFCWIGSNGYTMTGNFEVPDRLMSNAILTEDDIQRFKIVGYHNGERIGSWNAKQADQNTTWHFRFDPVGMSVLTGGRFSATHSQGWNANGNVQNCGNPGFGFNSGNLAQDICVNGRFISESSIEPETPIIATTAAVTPSCRSTNIMSKQ